MTLEPIKKRELIPEGDVEVLIQSIEKAVGKTGHPYVRCNCIVQDEGDHKGRLIVFGYGYYNMTKGLPTSIDEIESWQPRYGVALIRHTTDGKYFSVKKMVLI